MASSWYLSKGGYWRLVTITKDMFNGEENSRWFPYMVLAAVVIVGVSVIGLLGNSGGFAFGGFARGEQNFRETERGVSFDPASGAVFHAFNSSGYTFVTRSGVRFISAAGDTMWQQTLPFENVQTVSSREMLAVYEPRGRDAFVFSPSGLLYHRTFDGEILSASVNRAGSSAFIIETGRTFEIHVFDPTGFRVMQIIHADENVFPINVAITEDSQMAAVALLDVGGVNVRSRLSFYFLNEQALQYSDGVFARLQYDDEVIGKMFFFDDGGLVTFSDRAIRRIDVRGDLVSEVSVTELGNRISRLVRMGNGFAVALGDGFVGADSEHVGTVIAYDSTLNERFRFNPDRNTTYIWANDNSLIVGAGRSIYGLDNNGRMLWNYHATQDYTQVLMLENRDTILFAARSEARVMRRGR
ncbi:MAG: DUF5711 family protein [Defluviitaleaceae bacterium]|nr:DUF5711 family protein [Defluviitaleaceae bacterium]